MKDVSLKLTNETVIIPLRHADARYVIIWMGPQAFDLSLVRHFLTDALRGTTLAPQAILFTTLRNEKSACDAIWMHWDGHTLSDRGFKIELKPKHKRQIKRKLKRIRGGFLHEYPY